ncbi:MAG: sigma-70 family RNA polymerase sigma factor [Deltaproteobacteria bacterium]|nr:sigma-70 family RNA polymerase sigma factor [Deltaproteobacteria bacterium]
MRAPDDTEGGEDAVLIARLLAGDEQAFVEIVERLHGSLVRVARAFVGDRAVAEEVVQDTWAAVLEGLPRFEGRSSLKTWIFRILTNRARTRGARESRSVPFSSFDSVDEHEPAVDPARFLPSGKWGAPPRAWNEDSPERLLARRETLAFLEQAIAELPRSQRAVLVLRDVEGVDADDACDILQITENNQRVLLHRARSRLRAALEQHMAP